MGVMVQVLRPGSLQRGKNTYTLGYYGTQTWQGGLPAPQRNLPVALVVEPGLKLRSQGLCLSWGVMITLTIFLALSVPGPTLRTGE